MTPGRLEGKIAIVTGGATGIGEAICKKFAKEGAKVLIVGLVDDPVDEVVGEINKSGGTAMGFTADVSEELHAEGAVAAAVDHWGKLDILINNAGVFPEMNELQDFSVAAFNSLLKNNLSTVFMMTKAALPYLQRTRGCIVSAGSESGLKGIANFTPYGGTKGFIHAFMMGVAVEQAKHGVRANCVAPGPVDTAWTHKETGPMNAIVESMIVEGTPMGRRGTPEEIANVYLFLASDEASYVTASVYQVDGGIVAAKGAVGKEINKELAKQPTGELGLAHSLDGKPERK